MRFLSARDIVTVKQENKYLVKYLKKIEEKTQYIFVSNKVPVTLIRICTVISYTIWSINSIHIKKDDKKINCVLPN